MVTARVFGLAKTGRSSKLGGVYRRNATRLTPTTRLDPAVCKLEVSRSFPCPVLYDGLSLLRSTGPWRASFKPGNYTRRRRAAYYECSGLPGEHCTSKEERPSVHFVGIGGAGLSALAHVALDQGWRVSGSDVSENVATHVLQQAGATVHIGHAACHLDLAEEEGPLDAVVVSSAIPEGNPEVVAATSQGIPLFKRDKWLARITKEADLLAVAGTHGKTTTSAMLAVVLREVFGDDSTAVIGGQVPQFPGGLGAVVGSSRRFVLEADEYDGAFAELEPLLAIVTNVELDHVDIYASEAAVRATFAKFVGRVREGGMLLVCGDDAGARSLVAGFNVVSEQRAITRLASTYGLEQGNDWCATELSSNAEGGMDFVVSRAGRPIGRATQTMPGLHNVLNSLAVIAAAATVHAAVQSAAPGGPLRLTALTNEAIASEALRASIGLQLFHGVARRFQEIGASTGCLVYDDYAHHPTEVRATLQAARQRFGSDKIWVVFQPHTISRLERFWDEFVTAFSAADKVVITEVFKARTEKAAEGQGTLTGQDLAGAIVSPPALYIPSVAAAAEQLAEDLEAERKAVGSSTEQVVVIVMGAGDSNKLGPALLQRLQ
ncbi:hypothetical protein CYMTET_15438 [Cymbomonas tetramitiformis]|uniref:UDP-N-acetylmuramate--L-alanine ligase n=1 Tax=Cymbomonas tetramitiformis TaxID=36881 RepID=A0AAE0GED2_9CHLO|nr:hypothetical protein CYMTET_15438 [Cymbomonas tetramitiformis]